MKQAGIYGIKNTANKKWYVGQSISLHTRTRDEMTDLRKGRHHNSHLQAAWNKYGESSFELHILEELPEDMLDVRECAWIAFYHSDQPECGYNKESGGNLKKHASIETRTKISKSLQGQQRALGHTLSQEVKDHLAEINTGKKQSPETIEKRFKHRRGVSLPQEWCDNIAKGQMGKTVPIETRKKISKTKMGQPAWNKGKQLSEEHKVHLHKPHKKVAVRTIMKILRDSTCPMNGLSVVQPAVG